MDQVQQRSTFVTVLAWIFIVLSGLCTPVSIFQNIMIFTVFRGTKFSHMNLLHLFFPAFLLVLVFTLASSIGLLKRWNWARLCFVGIMVLGILWNLGILVFEFSMFPPMQDQFSPATEHGGSDMQPFFIVAKVFSVLFVAGFSALFGWIAKRLLSPAVAAEFRR